MARITPLPPQVRPPIEIEIEIDNSAEAEAMYLDALKYLVQRIREEREPNPLSTRSIA